MKSNLEFLKSSPFACPRFPFNAKTPAGYLGAVLIQCVTTVYHFILLASLIAFGVGAFLSNIQMAEDLENDLNSVNEIANITNDGAHTLEKFAKIVQRHSVLKQ